MTMFKNWQRTDPSPAHHGEPLSTFLDRVAQPLFERVRDLINLWIDALPDDAKQDLVARLRSPIDDAFRAAFWELYVHQALVRCGFDVAIHPTVEGTLKVPDFLATRADTRSYVEASAVGSSDASQSGDARRDRLYDELNKIDSPDFFLWLDLDAEGDTDVSLKELRRDLGKWLASLDPDDVLARIRESGSSQVMPRFGWSDEGWSLSVGAYPKSESARGEEGVRPLGIYGPGEARMIDDRAPLVRRMKRKSSRYGQLGAPFVLAISGSTFTTGEQDIVDALFGSEQITILTPTDGGEPILRPTRAQDGLWARAGGTGSTQVSAVLFVPYIEPWEVAVKVPVLVHHPMPDHPLELECPFLRIGTVNPSGRLLWRDPSQPINELFDLPGDWPGPEPAFVEGSI